MLNSFAPSTHIHVCTRNNNNKKYILATSTCNEKWLLLLMFFFCFSVVVFLLSSTRIKKMAHSSSGLRISNAANPSTSWFITHNHQVVCVVCEWKRDVISTAVPICRHCLHQWWAISDGRFVVIFVCNGQMRHMRISNLNLLIHSNWFLCKFIQIL